ncbi:MAG: outer membrane protein assembly factor BamB [Gammaproteobacteria bacterium]|nr:outer membrane protein assembly factor BamB [Gammaproteobacteria bacterium]
MIGMTCCTRVRCGIVLLIAFLFVITGCATDEEEVQEKRQKRLEDKEKRLARRPAQLKHFIREQEIGVRWERPVGGPARDDAVQLEPALSGSRVFAASADGNIMAVATGDGDVLWSVDVVSFYDEAERDTAFSPRADVIIGGVGLGADLVLVGTSAGDMVALNQSDGSLAWRTRMTSEVLAPPQADSSIVVAHAIDGRVTGHDVLDGSRQWMYTVSIPSLTIRGTATPLMLGEMVIAGFSNGRVVGLNKRTGVPMMDQRVAAAKGKSDLEKLIDIDGDMVTSGPILFVVSFQGNVVAINTQNGRILWARQASSALGLASGFGNVYVVSEDDHLIAMNEQNGENSWRNESLKNRSLSPPVTVSSFVVVSDYKGVMHVLAQTDGRFVARKRLDNQGMRAPVLADGNRMYAMGNSGRLYALEIR